MQTVNETIPKPALEASAEPISSLQDILSKPFQPPLLKPKEDSLTDVQDLNTSLSSQATPPQKEEKQAAPSETNWQDLYEKSQTSYKETQKWGQDLSRKLKSFEKRIQKMVEDTDLTPTEAKGLLEDVMHEELGKEMSPLERYGQIWDKELSTMRKYVEDQTLDQKVLAFQHFLHYGEKEDIESALQAFEELADDEVALTRKMLELGEQYNKDIFDSFSQAGSLKKFKHSYDEALQKAQQKIDQLEKKLLKYESNTEAFIPSKTYRLPVGGSHDASSENEKSIEGILDFARYGRL